MPLKPRTLTMDRKGKFQVYAYGPNHCGVDNWLAIQYRVICECTPDSLDKRGFLFDQINVDKFFQSIGRTKRSCESLCISCVKDLIKEIKKENPGCHINRMKLMLSPAPHLASMTYSWRG